MVTSLAPTDLAQHRKVQQLAYQCCEEIAATELRSGVTEREVAKKMRHWLLGHGVTDFFHIPFAWFGDRTRFRGFKNAPRVLSDPRALKFLPSKRTLEQGMAVTLDCAPIVDGYTADIGYSTRYGENPTFDRLFADLAEFRPFILERVIARKPLRDIWNEVDGLVEKMGYDNCHNIYPGHVLGHTVTKVGPPIIGRPIAVAFGVRALTTLVRELGTERVKGRSPLWGPTKHSDHPAYPGLWAVEPHIGRGDVGGKWEEILVVTESDAFWLDDQPSHVQRWQRTGGAR